MKMKFTAEEDPRVLLGRTSGNEVLAVRIKVGAGYGTQKFQDSRLASAHISHAYMLLQQVDSGALTAEQAIEAF